VRRSHPLIRDGKRQSWPSISRFGLRMAKEGAREEERHHSCFVYLESLERSKDMRMEALGEASLGALIHGGHREAYGFIILLCVFMLGGGCT
jgi:hypothetical protein